MNRLTEDQQQLAEEAVGRAEAIADRYARIFPEYEDDLKSSANWGAVRAAAHFKPELDYVWERWSRLCIKGEIKNFLLDAGRRGKPDDVYRLARSMPGKEQRNTDGADAFEWAMSVLPRDGKAVCALVYSDGITPSDAGVALGFSERRGRKIHRRAIEILRHLISDFID